MKQGNFDVITVLAGWLIFDYVGFSSRCIEYVYNNYRVAPQAAFISRANATSRKPIKYTLLSR